MNIYKKLFYLCLFGKSYVTLSLVVTDVHWWSFIENGCNVSSERHSVCCWYENSAPCGRWLCTAPVSILPSTAAGPSSTKLLICRNSSGSSPPTTVKPKPRRLFFSFVLMKVPFSSAGFLVKKGFPPAEINIVLVSVLYTRHSKCLNNMIETHSSNIGHSITYTGCQTVDWLVIRSVYGGKGSLNSFTCLTTHFICMHLLSHIVILKNTRVLFTR